MHAQIISLGRHKFNDAKEFPGTQKFDDCDVLRTFLLTSTFTPRVESLRELS